MPQEMHRYIEHLLSLYNSKPYISESAESVQRLQSLPSETFQRLIEKLNATVRKEDGTVWVGSHLWCDMENNQYFGCVALQVEFQGQVDIRGVKFATSSYNKNNSVIVFRKPSLEDSEKQEYGQIDEIFHHCQVCPMNITTVETFLSVSMYGSRVPTACDVFEKLGMLDLQADVRFKTPKTLVLLCTCDVIAHAAWLVYHSGELHDKIDQDTIGFINTNRE